MNALVPINTSNAEVYRASTDAAGLCKEIVVASALEIQGRKYVRVEDVPSAVDVARPGGFGKLVVPRADKGLSVLRCLQQIRGGSYQAGSTPCLVGDAEGVRRLVICRLDVRNGLDLMGGNLKEGMLVGMISPRDCPFALERSGSPSHPMR